MAAFTLTAPGVACPDKTVATASHTWHVFFKISRSLCHDLARERLVQARNTHDASSANQAKLLKNSCISKTPSQKRTSFHHGGRLGSRRVVLLMLLRSWDVVPGSGVESVLLLQYVLPSHNTGRGEGCHFSCA